MKRNKVKELWRQGKPAVAGWLSSGSPYIAELLAHVGYDAVVIDMQHGVGVTPDRAVECMQAMASTDVMPIVRVPWNQPEYIQYVLDAGAMGIIVPLVNSYDDAQKAGLACRYPPLGYRSIGPNRAALKDGAEDYLRHANEEIICLVMIENMEAVNRAAEISKAPGIDGVYIGPGDLAVSLGILPSQFPTDQRHLAACQKVLEAAQAAGVVPCHHGAGPADALRLFKQGFKMCQIGNDLRTLTAAANANMKALRDGMKA